MQTDISEELSFTFLPTTDGPKTVEELSEYARGFTAQPPLTLREFEYEKVAHILSSTDDNPYLFVDSIGGDFAVYNSLLKWAELYVPNIVVVGEVTSAAMLFICFAECESLELYPGVFGTLHSWAFNSDTRALSTTTKVLKQHFDAVNKDLAEKLNLSPKIKKKFLRGEDIFLTTDMIQKLLNKEL